MAEIWFLFKPKVHSQLPQWLSDKESICQCRKCWFDPWVREIPWRRMATHSSIPAWEFPWTEEPGVTKSWTQLNNSTTTTRFIASWLEIMLYVSSFLAPGWWICSCCSDCCQLLCQSKKVVCWFLMLFFRMNTYHFISCVTGQNKLYKIHLTSRKWEIPKRRTRKITVSAIITSQPALCSTNGFTYLPLCQTH